MKKSILMGLGACALALGGVAALVGQKGTVETKADDSPMLYLLGANIKANGNTYSSNWTNADPIATATLSDGYYTLSITFNEAGGKFKFHTSNDKWFGMSEYQYDSKSYPGLDLGQLGWAGDGTNITVSKAGTYYFRFSESTIVNTPDNGDIFHDSDTRVVKTADTGESYFYVSLGGWYNTEAWADNTVYINSWGTGTSANINTFPGRKMEPVGYGLYRILVTENEISKDFLICACNGATKGQTPNLSRTSENFYFHDSSYSYGASGMTGDTAGAVVIADYFLNKVTDSCDNTGVTPLSEEKWNYLAGVSATLGDGAIAAFKNASSEIIASKSRVLAAKERYQFIVNKAAYSAYEDYFGLRSGSGARVDNPLVSNSSAPLFIISGIALSTLAVGGLFLLRKRKAE